MVMEGAGGAAGSLHLHLVDGLLMGKEFALAGHKELLFLLASLKVVLLFRCQGSTETREGTEQGRHDAPVITCRKGPRLGGRAVWDADLGHEEWLARVTDATDELAKGLEVRILDLFDAKISREELCLEPIVHLETSEGTLYLALRVEVNPSHAVGHDHSARLEGSGIRWRLAARERAGAGGGREGLALGGSGCGKASLIRLGRRKGHSGRIGRWEKVIEDGAILAYGALGFTGLAGGGTAADGAEGVGLARVGNGVAKVLLFLRLHLGLHGRREKRA